MSSPEPHDDSLAGAIGSVRTANQHSSTKTALSHTVRALTIVDRSLAEMRQTIDELQAEIRALKADR